MKTNFQALMGWSIVGAFTIALGGWSAAAALSQTLPSGQPAPTAPAESSESIDRLAPTVPPTLEQQRQLERLRLERLERERLQYSLDQLQLQQQLNQQERQLQRQLSQQQQLQYELQQQRQQLEWQQDQRAFQLRNQQLFDRTFDSLNAIPRWSPPPARF